LNKRIKIWLALAAAMAIALSVSAAYVNQSNQADRSFGANAGLMSGLDLSGSSEIQQFVRENIQGELRRGSFETVVGGLRNLTFDYGGRVPGLNMAYQNDLWSGTLNCKVPTENMTLFTFDVRQLISEYGKVKHITISVTEVEADQSGQSKEPLSEVSVNLNEIVEGESPILSQLSTVVPWLTTGLVWTAQGLVIGVPLCFVSLGIVIMVDRGIIPLWKKQFKGKSLNQTTA